MRQSQLEIKSIEAELRSIRADKTSARSVSLLEAGSSANKPRLPESQNQIPQNYVSQNQIPQNQPAAIAPTITPTAVRQATPPKRPVAVDAQPKQKRQVECFPISTRSAQTQTAVSQIQLERVIEQLRGYSREDTRSPQHTPQHTPLSRQQVARKRQAAPPSSAIRQLLEEKAKQINDLSTQQEMAILELMEISGQLKQSAQKTDANSKLKNELALECEVAEIPCVERDRNGILVLTNRVIDSVKTPNERVNERMVAKAAQARQRPRSNRKHRIHWIVRIGQWIGQPVLWAGAANSNAAGLLRLGQAHTPRRTGYRGSGRRAATSAPEMPVTLTEAATLVVGAAALRILLDWVVASYPLLWIPSILVMIAPAAFAIYRSTVKPPTGFAWGYRLFAILIGLLLGGRL